VSCTGLSGHAGHEFFKARFKGSSGLFSVISEALLLASARGDAGRVELFGMAILGRL